jgi:hypothetical protein
MVVTVSFTTLVWVVVTLLTSPVEKNRLKEFYARVKPAGWWGPVAKELPEIKITDKLSRNLINWILGMLVIYGSLFGIGKIIFGHTLLGSGLIISALFFWWLILKNLRGAICTD